MRNRYETPEVEIVMILADSVIVTSQGTLTTPGEGKGDSEDYWG